MINKKALNDLGLPVYGDSEYRGACPLEMAEQVSFLSLLEQTYPSLGALAVHIENEGKRKDGARKKMQGMKKGAPDIMIPVNPPILIELKKRNIKDSSTTMDQINYLLKAKSQGAFVCFALGAMGAMEAIEQWHIINKK